jgi:hypothetical protein
LVMTSIMVGFSTCSGVPRVDFSSMIGLICKGVKFERTKLMHFLFNHCNELICRYKNQNGGLPKRMRGLP